MCVEWITKYGRMSGVCQVGVPSLLPDSTKEGIVLAETIRR